LRTVIATCALLAATTAAWADSQQPQTAPPPPANTAAPQPASNLPYSWAGFYLRGSPDLALGSGPVGGTNAITGLSGATASGPSSQGGIDSGMVGANWQNGSTVIGFEGDMQWTGQSASAVTACGMGCSLNDRMRVPWMATLRARAGKTFDRVFVYGTGGFATVGTADNLNANSYGTTPNFVDLSAGNINWAIGGGMEMALDRNVSAKIEYLYAVPTGTQLSLFDPATNEPGKSNILRGGIHYQLPVGQ
jgi:outer membrane immunogenic protein